MCLKQREYSNEGPKMRSEHFYGWLIQFTDENRLDLHVETVIHAQQHITDDKLCKVLLDKKGILPELPEPTDKDYWVEKPTESQYLCACNEFWWCLNNVAKGLWRNEMPYVQDMVSFHVRKQLETLLSWKVGLLTDFSVNIGKSGKYMYRWLDKVEWEEYLSTYFSGIVSEAWEAVITMCDLFEQTAFYVGERLGFRYNEVEGKNARGFLEHVRQLSQDAAAIY